MLVFGALTGIAAVTSSCVSAPLGGARHTETTLNISGSKRTEAFTVSFLKRDCTFSSYPYTGVVEPSRHGKIEIEHGKVTPHFSLSTDKYMCNHRRVEGTIVYYTPDVAFVGSDQFTVRVTGLHDARGVSDHVVKIRVVK